MPVSKRKRVSKKTKLSWRKHVDIGDVENFLEEQRLQQRLGKPVTEKTDEELFQVDTKPAGTPTLTSKQKRRMLLQERLPKCFSMLQSHSEVPDPVIKRNRVKTKEERKNILIKKKEEERRRQGILKAKELQSLKDQHLYELKKATKPAKGDFTVDIWNSKVSDVVDTNEWIGSNTKHHNLRGTGQLPKTVPKSVKAKRSIVPSVEPPHPGTSYNPSFIDHQKLLQEVVSQEVKIMKKKEHLNRVTRGMFNKVSATEKEQNWLSEMSEGLQKHEENGSDDAWEEYKSCNPPVQNKKKNLKQRRKQKEQQQLEHARKSAKIEKKKTSDIYRLKFLKLDIANQEKKAQTLREKRQKKQAYKQLEPKRLSSIKFQGPEAEINMPEDIAGNLRNVKKEGSLLVDRFKSLQKRNILQPTVKHNHKRAKVKRFTKSGHKDDWKVTVAIPRNKS